MMRSSYDRGTTLASALTESKDRCRTLSVRFDNDELRLPRPHHTPSQVPDSKATFRIARNNDPVESRQAARGLFLEDSLHLLGRHAHLDFRQREPPWVETAGLRCG